MENDCVKGVVVMKIKQILQGIYRSEAVYELRRTPILLTIFVGMLFGILHMTPFTLRLFLPQTYRFDLQIWDLNDELRDYFLQNLPEACYISNGVFNCHQLDGFAVGEAVDVYFNHADADISN